MTRPGPGRRRRRPEILAVDEVSVSLAGRQILDDVSFTVGPGSSPA